MLGAQPRSEPDFFVDGHAQRFKGYKPDEMPFRYYFLHGWQ